MDSAFKLPQAIPQDLLLIQELIGVSEVPTSALPAPLPEVKPATQDADDINSSEDENDSEDEIAADLITGAAIDEDDLTKDQEKLLSEPSESISDSSDSDSDSSSDESSDEEGDKTNPKVSLDIDDDEDPVPAAGANTYFTTKHEVQETEIPIPEVDEVGSEEVLEKVGDVMNIIDRLVIVRGLPADSPVGYPARGSDRALDSETLLVFDDRKVMGYIYETFGPTTQPFYQVKFNSAFPLNPGRVRIGREVFHVPARSRFVFVNQIKAFKGSDASNVHDEEPADDELEFSDDEAEAAYKSRLKRKRGESRARSVASSRQSTPNPTQMRDQELADDTILSRNAYDENGPYDIDYAAPGPSSRPAPIPYDDPYGDAYTAPDVADRDASTPSVPTRSAWSTGGSNTGSGYGRAGRRGDESSYERQDGSGRGQERDRGLFGGRGRERGRGGRGRGRGRGGGDRGSHQQRNSHGLPESQARPLSPTSFAIARATGQADAYTQPQQQVFQQQGYNPQDMYSAPIHSHSSSQSTWGYPQMTPQQYHPQQTQQMHQYASAYVGYQQQNQTYQNQPRYDFGAMVGAQNATPFVQPHINPRFASAFGLGLPQMSQGYNPAAVGVPGLSNNAIPPAILAPSGVTSLSSSGWAATPDEWSVPVQPAQTPSSIRPGSANGGADMDTQK